MSKKEIFVQHNTETPLENVDDQCQCDDCKAYREESAKPAAEAAAAEAKAKQEAYDAEIARRVAEELAKKAQE